MSVATAIVRAVPIARHVDRSVFDLHLACGHVLVAEVMGDDRDNPMRGWQAMCWICGRGDAAQPDLFAEPVS